MNRSMEQLKLVIPGLVVKEYWPVLEQFAPRLSISHLEKLLSRGQQKNIGYAGLIGALFDIYDVQIPQGQDLPVAVFSRLGDGSQVDNSWWMCMESVHLRADRDSIVLMPSDNLNLTMDEAKALASEIEQHFNDLNWHIEVLNPQRWYLRLPQAAKIITSPLNDVAGKHINNYLPVGEEARQWHALLNEVQMLLHVHPINQARQVRGDLPINGMWFWGGGSLPEIKKQAYTLYGSGSLERGVASYAGNAINTCPDDYVTLCNQHKETSAPVVVLNQLNDALSTNDIPAWCEVINTLEENWFRPVRLALKKGELKEMTIYGGDGSSFSTNTKMQRCFWKKRKSLFSY